MRSPILELLKWKRSVIASDLRSRSASIAMKLVRYLTDRIFKMAVYPESSLVTVPESPKTVIQLGFAGAEYGVRPLLELG